jgi:hypothetical protein
MFLISISAVAAIGVIAGGAFWTAQSVGKLTDGKHAIMVKHCEDHPNVDACK